MAGTKTVRSKLFFDKDHNVVDEKDALFVEIHYSDGSVAYGIRDVRGTID